MKPLYWLRPEKFAPQASLMTIDGDIMISNKSRPTNYSAREESAEL